MAIMPDAHAVAALRQRLWGNDFRPVPCLTNDKVPLGRDWPERARQNPPECLHWLPVRHAMNTGLLGDGLRVIDCDIDDATLMATVASWVCERCGEAPTRYRANSPRRAMLYRAAEGAPPKRSIVGTRGKLEVLGRGQQLLAFGTHPSGAELQWTQSPVHDVARAQLAAVNEAQIGALLSELAPLLGAPPEHTEATDAEVGGGVGEHIASEPLADIARIAVALAQIPNCGPPDWEFWNRVGMAVWRASGGSDAGLRLWIEWSQQNPACGDADTPEARWQNYRRFPPTGIGFGFLHYASQRALQARMGGFLDTGS
jgi:hypothetical protein